MYRLPKIHKSGIPLRPILSMCHSAQHSLAKWLVEVLNLVLEFYSVCCVKDSYIFLHYSLTARLYGVPIPGPILANIFVGFHERRLFDRFPKPFIYLRYVDDTFVSFKSCSDALVFFDTLNQLHSSLSFTIEEENNGQLPFLDVLVERCDSSFFISVYRKPHIHWAIFGLASFCP